MKLKSFFTLLFSLTLSLVLVGCSIPEEPSSSSESPSTSESSSQDKPSSSEIISSEVSSSDQSFSSSGEEIVEPVQLDTPVITVSSTGLATWIAIPNAAGYKYVIDNLEEVSLPSTTTYLVLTHGQSLKVKAVGDATAYLDSDYSEVVTYLTPIIPEPVKLSTPVVTISEEGLASWEAIVNASSYVYKINEGSEQSTTSLSVQLEDGDSIVVKAVGDGTNYTDSDYSTSVTYVVETPTPDPVKLTTPVVTISQSGLASWLAVSNASSYVYKINEGSEQATTSLSVQLEDGDSIVVKAVGDGTNYTDSDFNEKVTYSAPTVSTEAPTYLGIIASNNEPSENEVPSNIRRTNSISLEDSLRAYLSDSENSLGETLPQESDYDIYSASGSNVYIQIWLDNPDQNTILSLKLNGTKYQSGGALQSFFIEDNSSYLNCVYVALTIPANSYEEISYEVTEIEYVEGNNISQDGKSVLIDEDNDTVVIGLPYQESLPLISDIDASIGASSLTLSATIVDSDNYLTKVDSWLRVVLIDQNNQILGQDKLEVGSNQTTFNNLSAYTYYHVMVFVLSDNHDGNGVYAHSILYQQIRTSSAVTLECNSSIELDESSSKYYPLISVEGTICDSNFSFTKIEIIDTRNDEVVYTSSFDGSIDISENLKNGQDYIVRVYYENVENVEQYIDEYVYIDYLNSPYVNLTLEYGLINDAIIGFEFSDDKYNISNVVINIYDEYSKEYLAEDALYLINNSTAIEDLQAQWSSMSRDDPNFASVYDRYYKLSQAKDKIDGHYSTLTKAEWETLASGSKYLYTYTLGVDEEFFKGPNNMYYVILDDYQNKRVNDNSWGYFITADIDYNSNYYENENIEITNGYFSIYPFISEYDLLFVPSDEDYNPLFTLDENNIVYLEVNSRTSFGKESSLALGYVNQIFLELDYEIVQVLWSQEDPGSSIDEASWMNDIKAALLNGNDIDSAYPLGELTPITFDLDDITLITQPGQYRIGFSYIMYGKEYSVDNPYDLYYEYIDYQIRGPLPQASIEFNEYGEYQIIIPQEMMTGYWNYYQIEVLDENGDLIGSYTHDNYYEIPTLKNNYSMRIKLLAPDSDSYYLDGEWSDYFVFEASKLSTPSNFNISYNVNGITLSWDYVSYADTYAYVINNGEELSTYENSISGLKDNDQVKVKAIPNSESCYVESVYSDIYVIEDSRTPLDSVVASYENKILSWNEVTNVNYYIVYDVTNDEMYRRTQSTSCSVDEGRIYQVFAYPSDYTLYSPSSSELINVVASSIKLSTPVVTISEDGLASWTAVSNASSYVYKINEGSEQSTTSLSVQLEDGDSIVVKAVGDGTNYTDSDYSISVTYVVETPTPDPVKLSTPVVTISEEGLASWTAVPNASSYKYKINDGSEQSTTSLSVQLEDGDSIVVKAVGDGTNYTDSDYSEEVSYDDGIITIGDIVDNYDTYLGQEVTITGTIYGLESNALYLIDYSTDKTIFIHCDTYGYSNVSIGQEVTATGTIQTYYTLPQLKLTQSLVYGSVGSVTIPSSKQTIQEFISDLPTDLIHDHKVGRIEGTFVIEDSNYYLVDGDYRVQFRGSTYSTDLNYLINNYQNKRIQINVILSDMFSSTGIYRVVPLRGSLAGIETVYDSINEVNTIDSEYTIYGTVMGVSSTGFILEDDTDAILIYMGSSWTCDVSIGDILLVKGTCATHGGIFQLKNSTYSKSTTEVVVQPTPITITSSNISQYAENIDITYVKLTGTLSISGIYHNLTIDGTTYVGSIDSPNMDLSSLNGKVITVYGYYTGITGSSTQYFRILPIVVEESIASRIQAEYVALKAGTTTEHTTFTFDATVCKMTSSYSDSYSNYTIHMIVEVEDLRVGLYALYIDGSRPTSESQFEGLGVGSLVRVSGIISEDYTLTIDEETVNIEFSNPELLSYSDKDEGSGDEEPEITETDNINFFMINDTHGSLIDSSSGYSLARVDTLVNQLETNNGEYILVHNGDAFQGSYVSGITYGRSVIDGLNAMEFDCFVIGNHEFDWGLDKIATYKDGDESNGEANFPFLGANIKQISTGTIPSWIEPYHIKQYGDYRVGIIGVMGEDIETTITAKYVADYEFTEIVPVVEEYATYLRTTEACDTVIVAIHDHDDGINSELASLTGDAMIDLILTSHTHQQINTRITRSDGKSIAVVQNTDKNKLASSIILNYASDTKSYNGVNDVTQYSCSGYAESERVLDVIANYQSIIDEGNSVIGYTDSYLDRTTLANDMIKAQLIYDYSSYGYTDLDLAMINYGGVRADISKGEITKAEAYEVAPFDNYIVLCKIKGSDIKTIYGVNSKYLALGLSSEYSSYTDLDDDTIYTLAVLDFVFDNRKYYPEFDNVEEGDYIVTSIFARNIFYQAVEDYYPIQS